MKKKKYGYQTRRKYKIKQLSILFVLVICSISLVSIFGRYAINSINDFFLRTKEFYFYSDKLTENTANYQIDNWSGVDDYVITINMNSNKNNLVSASYDIPYNITYTCSNNAICQLSKTSGIIYSGTNADSFNITITPNAIFRTGDRVQVQITAISDSEYTKTLSANFILVVGQEQLSYEIVDTVGNPYLDLNITNTLSYYTVKQAFSIYAVNQRIDIDTYLSLSQTDKDKCYSATVTLNFNPNTILLDMTNTNYLNASNITTTTLNGERYINSITFDIDAISSATVKFYKTDISQNYTYPNNNTSIITVTSI